MKYGEHQGTFYSVKLRVCVVGTWGQQEGVLGVLKLAGVVMGNCVGGCEGARPDLVLPMLLPRVVPGVNGPSGHAGVLPGCLKKTYLN